MFENYNYLGFRSPYYFRDNSDKICVFNSFEEAIKNKDDEYSELDVNGVIQVLSRYHCFGDRTLIKGLKRTPWMAKPTSDYQSWDYHDIPPHGQILESPENIARKLEKLLEKELLTYIHQSNNVGILLSGGMDSRILAAILHNLIKKHNLKIDITGLTWGMSESRDVVYARKISDLLNWKWKHFELSAENLVENISVTAKYGCEFSPLHLHAMPKVRDYVKGFDCILAASYGDSIGRGEYSGTHLTQLKEVEKYVRNWFGLFKNEIFTSHYMSVKEDAINYRKKYSAQTKIGALEIEKQSQYWRRQLNTCFSVIEETCPVYQIFTSPDVFKYVWSLNVKCRNDSIYSKLLYNVNSELLEIPWARTGLKYGADKGEEDKFKKNHNFYGLWVRDNMKELIRDKVLSDELESLSIFNMKSLEKLYSCQQNEYDNYRHTKIDEILIWLASLSIMVKDKRIKNFEDVDLNLKDSINIKFKNTLEIKGYKYLSKFRGYY